MARLGVLNKSGRVSQLKGKDLDAFMQEREFQATHGQNENTKEHILHLTVTI
jgi:hypothetical protein